MIRFFEERFLLSNILEVGKILIMGTGYNENYYMASRGFSTVSINLPKAMNHFIIAKMLRNPVNADLFSVDFGGFEFPFEFFDYAAFLNNSFELLPYRNNRRDVLNFVNRFLKNDSFLSISLYNINSPENKKIFEKGEFITEVPSIKIDSLTQANYTLPFEKGDFFYFSDGPNKEERFRHIFEISELKEDLKDSGFETIEITDNKHILEGTTTEIKEYQKTNLTGQFIIVSARKVRPVKITRQVS